MPANPDAEETRQYIEQLETIKQDRASLLVDEAKKRVERNPTDLQLRFELGEILVNLGNYKDAIAELQKARQNPNVRLRAMNQLASATPSAECLTLAANTLSTAASELAQMDTTKKDIVHNLGIAMKRWARKKSPSSA